MQYGRKIIHHVPTQNKVVNPFMLRSDTDSANASHFYSFHYLNPFTNVLNAVSIQCIAWITLYSRILITIYNFNYVDSIFNLIKRPTSLIHVLYIFAILKGVVRFTGINDIRLQCSRKMYVPVWTLSIHIVYKVIMCNYRKIHTYLFVLQTKYLVELYSNFLTSSISE